MGDSGHVRPMTVKLSSETNAKIGARIRRLRELLGFNTQTAFANKLEIAPNRLNQYEVGARFLTIDVAIKIHNLTQCPLDYLYFGHTHGLPAFLRDLATSPDNVAA